MLEAAKQVLDMLSPQNQELVLSLLRQLAEREGIAIRCEASPGLQTPLEGLGLWEASLMGQNYSSETVRSYKLLVVRYLEDDPVPTKQSVMQFLADRMQCISPTGVDNWLKALKSFFGFLKEEGLWPQNPVASIPSPKLPRKERAIPTEEEITKLLNALASDTDARRNKPKLSAWLTTLVTTGVRRRELATLTWDNVDFEGLQMTVWGKGDKWRTVPILPLTAWALKEYRQTLPVGTDRVFPSNGRDGVWDTTASNRMIARLCGKAGIRRYTAHQFRHFFATYTLEHAGEGAIKAVSEILGHANPGITLNFYIHTSKARIAKLYREAAPLNGMLLPPAGGNVGEYTS